MCTANLGVKWRATGCAQGVCTKSVHRECAQGVCTKIVQCAQLVCTHRNWCGEMSVSLHAAARNNWHKKVRELVKAGADVNQRAERDGATPCYIAAGDLAV